MTGVRSLASSSKRRFLLCFALLLFAEYFLVPQVQEIDFQPSISRGFKTVSLTENKSLTDKANCKHLKNCGKGKLFFKEGDKAIEKLIQAIEQDDDQEVERLLQQLSIDVTYGLERSSLLHLAAKRDSVNTAKVLIDHHGANLEAQDAFLGTPLHAAAMHNAVNVSLVLLQSGAQIDAGAIEKRTPLSVAVVWNSTDVMKILIKHGANVNYFDNNGITPLYEAATRGRLEAAKLLIAYGASKKIKDDRGGSAYKMACKDPLANCTFDALNTLRDMLWIKEKEFKDLAHS